MFIPFLLFQATGENGPLNENVLLPLKYENLTKNIDLQLEHKAPGLGVNFSYHYT